MSVRRDSCSSSGRCGSNSSSSFSVYHAFGHLSVHVVLEDRPDNDRQASTYDFRYFVLQRGDFYATDTELYSVRQLAKK